MCVISLAYIFNKLSVYTNTYIKQIKSITQFGQSMYIYVYAKFSVHVDRISFKITNNKVSKTNCYKAIDGVLPHTHTCR